MAMASRKLGNIFFISPYAQPKSGASTVRRKKRMNTGGQLIVSVIILSSFQNVRWLGTL